VKQQLAILGGEPVIRDEAYRRWPDIQESDRKAVMSVLDRGILTGGGSVEAPGFAREYGEYAGARHCLAFNSGTAALHACAVASGLQPGDEVIVPAFTYVASAIAFALHGVRPVFVDSELNSYLMDPRRVEEKITARTKAIVVVHLHGLPCDMDALLTIAKRRKLLIIEDISQAHGATYKGKVVGTFGYCAGGSLNATKNLPGGEGGMFLTNDDKAVVPARRLRYMGEDPTDDDPAFGRRYWSYGLGYNYRPQELPFAFARSQLKRLTKYNEIAQHNARMLTAGLREIRGVAPPEVPDDRTSIWYMYRVRLAPEQLNYSGSDTELRDRVMTALAAEGLRVMLWQHHPIPAFATFRRKELRPWVSGMDQEELRPWNPREYPVATQLCRQTFIVGSGTTPLAGQTEELIRGYVAAFRKVFDNLDEVLKMDFESPADTVAADAFDSSSGRLGEPPALPVT
jgi:perosamine synthetase